MALDISILTMGIDKQRTRELIRALDTIPGTDVRCRTREIFKNHQALTAIFDLVFNRSNGVIFYWDIAARPGRLKMALVFFLFGMLGMQYILLSRTKTPVIVLSPAPSPYFLHADIVAYIRTLGNNAYLAESLEDVKNRIQHLAKPPVWGGKKVLIFGKPFKSATIRSPRLTRDYIYRRTGITVDYKPIRALLNGIKSVDSEKTKQEMDQWTANALHVKSGLSREIEGACRMYLYLKECIDKDGYDGISISCISKDFPENPVMPHPCLAFSRFRDTGIAAVCEADLCALFTAMLMEHVAGKPSYMGNVAFVDTQASTVLITHCVTALKPEGYDTPPLPYSLKDYHHTGKGVVPSVDFPVDKTVTLGLVSKDLNHFVLWPGSLIETGADFCVNMARIKIADARGFKQTITGCHYVMVYGNIVKDLHTLLLDLNITPIGPVNNV